MSKSARVFLSYEDAAYQIFSFEQNTKGDIYCNWPSFEKTRWLFVTKNNEGQHVVAAIDDSNANRLTFHVSGFTAYKSSTSNYKESPRFNSSPLVELSSDEERHNIRHLFTVHLQKPYHKPAGKRATDYILKSSYSLEPCIASFFAIPRMNLEVDFGIKINMGDVPFRDNNHDCLLGFAVIELEQHSIVGVFYRTTNLTWPNANLVAYCDGYHIPLIRGLAEDHFQIAWVKPDWSLDGNKFSMTLSISAMNDKGYFARST